MKALVATSRAGGLPCDSEKLTDLSKPGNVKWLSSHIKWAIKNDLSVSIHPVAVSPASL